MLIRWFLFCLALVLAVPVWAQEAGDGMDFSDWDWSAVSDEAAQPVAKPKTQPEAAKPNKPRPGETAVPDYDAEPRVALQVFAEVPEFKVIPSRKDVEMIPCGNCHQWAQSDLTPRILKEPHNNFVLQHGLHGKGQFWCFTCHHLEGQGGLRTLEGEKLDFDQAYLLCSQCHVQEARDWASGAHGKRVGNWNEEREVLNCTACHYQHRPGWLPRTAMPGPEIRMGLERPEHWVPWSERGSIEHLPKPIWEPVQ